MILRTQTSLVVNIGLVFVSHVLPVKYLLEI